MCYFTRYFKKNIVTVHCTWCNKLNIKIINFSIFNFLMHVYDLILLDSTANLHSEYILGLFLKLIVMVNHICITCWVSEQLPELPSRWRYLSTYLKYSALYCVTPEYESSFLLHFSFSFKTPNSDFCFRFLVFPSEPFRVWCYTQATMGVHLWPFLTLFDPFNINSTWMIKVVQQMYY